ncbi:TetR/AcrR family transcriptional regulator [bacterium]|nr:MAG: TetR/AcrR family transcriptional regulator [bacterium]
MPRTKTFEPQEALRSAMQLFWERGFGHTSIDELVRSTGVQRYGLYSSFGGKQGLFRRSLDLYRDEVAGRWMAPLKRPDASLQQIRAFFEQFDGQIGRPQGRLGCLMVVASAEAAPLETATRKRVSTHFEQLQAALAAALDRAAVRGELRANVNVQQTAALLLGALIGLLSLMRSPAPRDLVVHSLRGVLHLIDELREPGARDPRIP